MAYNPHAVATIKSWPDSSTQHELRSLRREVAKSVYSPDEIRITEIEKAFRRPMIQFTMLNQRGQNRSQFDFSIIKNVAVTFFGSTADYLNDDERHFEAIQVADFLSEFFCRGSVHGPLIPIYDFSEDEPTLTGDWMEIDTATVSTIKDEFGLWMVPVDLRYAVARDEVTFGSEPEVIILNIVRRVEIG